MKKKNIKPVRIEWIDSASSGGWHKFKKADLTCITIGFIYKDLPDRYVIAQSWSPHYCADYISIPKVAVIGVVELISILDREPIKKDTN